MIADEEKSLDVDSEMYDSLFMAVNSGRDDLNHAMWECGVSCPCAYHQQSYDRDTLGENVLWIDVYYNYIT